jgi:hypothetical protein
LNAPEATQQCSNSRKRSRVTEPWCALHPFVESTPQRDA